MKTYTEVTGMDYIITTLILWLYPGDNHHDD